MSDYESREDDARREPIIAAIRNEYDQAAAIIAWYMCHRRHGPKWEPPHIPGTCDMAQQIENALWLAKDPPGPGMTNPPRVYADDMQAFITRVSERTGIQIGGN